MLWRYPRQEWTGKVLGLTDSNWAACPVTRKSSSATYLMLGKHPIFAASSSQTILSLSSGEAEFYGAVRCACRTLGLKSLMTDLSLDVKAELVTDSSACKGLCSRRGAGRIRHIHCPALWLQHTVARRQISITRRAGKDLAPDVGTKAGIPEDTMWRLLGRVKVERSKHGRSASEGLRTWLRHVCTTNFEQCSLFPCSLHQALFRLRWMSFCDHRYFSNCFSQFRATCVFCLQFSSFRSFSLKWFGTAGSLLFCNSRCDMCELGTLIFPCSALSLVESRQMADSSCIELQFAGKCFQSSYPGRGAMIVPVNRVAMAPRD